MFPPEQEQDYHSERRESKHELTTLTREQSVRGYRAYIELFFRSTFFSSVAVVLGPLAQLVNSEVTRRSAVIAINLFFIPPLLCKRCTTECM